MRNFVLLAATLAPLAAHAVVATTSTFDPGPQDASWTGVGAMSGASAVAIGPHLVLTAGHVSAGDFLLGGDVYRMVSTEIAPAWRRKGVDLRLVTVDETLPTWYAVANSVARGSTVTMVGMGGTGVVNAAGTGYAVSGGGERHAGANTVSSKETTSGVGPTLRAMLDSAGEASLAPGDSGGGWFVNGQLVGISAFTFTKKTSRPDYGWAKPSYFGSGAVDLTNGALNGWLDDQVEDDLVNVSQSSSLQAVPEPAGLAALGLGVAGILRRRKNR